MMGFARSRTGAVLVLLFAGLVAAGCTQTKSFVHEDADERLPGAARVLLMEPDVELSELTAAGPFVPNAGWSEVGRIYVDEALRAFMAGRNTEIVDHVLPGDVAAEHPEAQLLKLHGAVGLSILVHKYIEGHALPTKKNGFDWTLGPAAATLRQKYDADYAVFVYLRDSYSGSGRSALITIGALAGVIVPVGEQVGFASLVDLNTGNVLWFNRFAGGAGDLREFEAAAAAVEDLLDDLPL
jgi:hypothetical protein